MLTQYWIFEYGKVIFGYLFLMFLWPSIIFRNYLRTKSVTYRFCFCVTIQVILVDIVVLLLGFSGILSTKIICFIFYGIMFLSLLKLYFKMIKPFNNPRLFIQEINLCNFRNKIIKTKLLWIWQMLRPHFLEYICLLALIIYGIIYFSYVSLHHYSYGNVEMYYSHLSIYNLLEGKITVENGYPDAMQCFVYSMYALFNIKIYNILLFLAGIHIVVFLVSVYSLMREIFRWRYTPFFVLATFLFLDLWSVIALDSMSFLQWTTPTGFCIYTPFLCALYMVRYLKNSHHIIIKDKISKCCWDENLFLFIMSLISSFMTYFPTTFLVFLLCLSFALFSIKNLMSKEHFFPLMTVIVFYILFITIALFEKESDFIFYSQSFSNITSFKEIFNCIYENGYVQIYGQTYAKWIVSVIGLAIILCFIYYLFYQKHIKQLSYEYPAIIFASVLLMIVFSAHSIGLSEFINNSCLYITEHILILITAAIPVDMAFSLFAFIFRDYILQILSVICIAEVYILTISKGSYHGYLYCNLMRYNAAVTTTNSIINEFPRYSYTIVAPTDDVYQILQYGYHTESLTFLQECDNENFTLPTEYVFIYIEKKPIQYYQYHFFEGPSWLASEKKSQVYSEDVASQCPEIFASEITQEKSLEEISFKEPWSVYSNQNSRTILESKLYNWVQCFSQRYPSKMNIYYENDKFICYYFQQEPNTPYNLGIKE